MLHFSTLKPIFYGDFKANSSTAKIQSYTLEINFGKKNNTDLPFFLRPKTDFSKANRNSYF
ncbi:hypothetical protein B0A80_06205 [Flavobacterium tructae]|nr:hypothetical protein B0A80_06205 [Flavobacterium tructae]